MRYDCVQNDSPTTARLWYDSPTTAWLRYDCITSMTQILHDYNATIARLRYDYNTPIWHAYDTTGNRLGYDWHSTIARLRHDYSTTIKRFSYDCMRLWHDYGTTGVWLQYDYGPIAVRLQHNCNTTFVRLHAFMTRLQNDWDTTAVRLWHDGDRITTTTRPPYDCRQCNNGTTAVLPLCDSPTTHDSIVPISRRKVVSLSYPLLTWSIRCIDPWPFWRKHEQGECNKHGHSGISNETEK